MRKGRPEASRRDQFAQRLRHLLGRAGLTQAMLARQLRHHGFPNVTEPRVSDWIHGRNLPRDESVVFAIETMLANAGIAMKEGGLVARYWAARPELRPDAGRVPDVVSQQRQAGTGRTAVPRRPHH